MGELRSVAPALATSELDLEELGVSITAEVRPDTRTTITLETKETRMGAVDTLSSLPDESREELESTAVVNLLENKAAMNRFMILLNLALDKKGLARASSGFKYVLVTEFFPNYYKDRSGIRVSTGFARRVRLMESNELDLFIIERRPIKGTQETKTYMSAGADLIEFIEAATSPTHTQSMEQKIQKG